MGRNSIVFLVLFASVPTSAAPPRVHLGPCKWQGIPATARKRLLAAARKALRSNGYVLTSASKAQASLACTVEALGNTYLFTIRSSCAPGAARRATFKGTCEVCRLAEAAASFGRTVLKAARSAKARCAPRPARPRATRGKTTRPPGRPTPATQSTPAARPRPAQPPAARPTPEPGSATAGPPAAAASSRTAVPAEATAPPTVRRSDSVATWLEVSGWVIGGVGVALLTAGAVFVAIDGKGTCDGPGQCPEVYNTKELGIGLLAGGGAAVAGAVALVVTGRLRSRRHDRRRAQLSVGPGTLVWAWHF